MICICGKEHDGTYGAGKFCSRSCSNKRIFSKESKEKISKSLSGVPRPNRRLANNDYVCVSCKVAFSGRIRIDRKIVCNKCKRNVVHHLEGNDFDLFDLSSRTVSKILKRAKLSCGICGWNESSCDIHHIVEKSKGGSNELSNLIYVCPNHHRIIHKNKTYSKEFLFERSLATHISNWKDFYNGYNKDVN